MDAVGAGGGCVPVCDLVARGWSQIMPVVPAMRFEGLGGGAVLLGLGAGSYGSTAISYGGAAAGQIVSGSGSLRENILLSAPQLAGTGVSIAALLGMGAAKAALPVVGPVVAGATIAISLWKARKGPYQKTQTTKVVDEAEPILQDNVRGFLEGPRTAETQAWALKNFDDVWGQIERLCGDPAMGAPGQRCISERTRGGTAPWCPTGTGCDWFILYRDPIANAEVTASSPAADLVGSIFGDGGGLVGGDGGISPLLLIGAGLLAAAVLL